MIRLLRALTVAGVAATSACGPSSSLLQNARPSPHELSTAVLDAVQRSDIEQLRSLALSEQEFREHIWPELPASRPERNLPFSYVWGDLRQKSEAALSQTVARHGGRHYTLISVSFAGDTTRYPTYTVHRETVLRVRDDGDTHHELRLFGSSVHKDGTWKVFSYIVDD